MNCKIILFETEIYKLAALPDSFKELKRAIQKKLGEADISDFRLKYKDNEEELITLQNEEDYQIAIMTCKTENLKNLKIYVLEATHNKETSFSLKQISNENSFFSSRTGTPKSVKESINACYSNSATSPQSFSKASGTVNKRFTFSPRNENNKDQEEGKSCSKMYSGRNMNRNSASSSSEKKPDYKAKFTSTMKQNVLKVGEGEIYDYYLTLKNVGGQKWPSNVKLACINGIHKGEKRDIPSLNDGDKYDIKLSLEAPKTSGKYLSQWRLHYEDGNSLKGFGMTYFIEIKVSNQIRKENQESLEKVFVEDHNIKLNDEKTASRNGLRLAEMLNDMFPGDLWEKIEFVESCPKDYNIYQLVDKYLVSLKKVNNSKKIFGSQAVFA